MIKRTLCYFLLLISSHITVAAEPEPLSDPAYQDAVKQALPLTDEEIRDFRQRADDISRAATALPRKTAPKVITTSQPVDISPGATIPAVTLFPEMQSHLVLLDQSGQPWPLERWTISGTQGNAERFVVSQSGINILTVSSGLHYAYGNLGLKLVDLDTMVVINLLQSSQADTVDARKELHIQRLGPLAKPVLETAATGAFDPVLYDFLDNLPPAQAQEQTVHGDPTARAWLYQDQLVVRTQRVLLSPAWDATTQAADGTRIYALSPSPDLLFSIDGQMVHVSVTP